MGLQRRATTARLAYCSRSVKGKSTANEVHVAPQVWLIRPPRLLARLPTIRRPRPNLILPGPDPLSVTRQFTHEPARICLISISPSRASKQACRTAFVTSSWTASARRQHRADSSGSVSADTKQMDVHAIQLASAHGQAEFAKLFPGVQERVPLRHLQNAMDIGMPVKQVDDVAQLFLGVNVVGPDRPGDTSLMARASSFVMRWFSSSSRVRGSRAGGCGVAWGMEVSRLI